MKVRFVPRQNQLVTIYSDQLVPFLKQLSGEVTYQRASHVDPTPCGRYFQIVWRNEEVIASLGERITRTDGQGLPFETKGAAVRHEVELLKRVLFSTSRSIQDDHDSHQARSPSSPVP